MSESDLQADYRRVLEACRGRGEVLEEPAGQERRSHPRILVNPADLPAELDPWVFAIDISISGMAFFADEPVEKGKMVTVHLGDQHSAKVEVMGCRPEAPESPGQPERYRLHCRFADEEEGLRLLIAIKDLEAHGD